MNAADHVRAAIDELDSEWVQLRERLDEVSEQRVALAAWLGALEGKASPRDTPDPALPAGPTATAGVPAPSGGTPVTPRTTATPRPNPGTGRKRNDLAEVARVAREALAAGRPMREAVAAHLGCGESGAGQAITKARRAGHDIPAAPGGQAGARLRRAEPLRPAPNADALPAPEQRPVSTWSPKPGENVVVCDECGHVEPITGVSALNRHCLAQHRRAATVEERTPRPWGAAA